MKNIVMIIVLIMGVTATAQDKNKNARHTVEVNGNCDMCKKRIEKAAYSVSGVKSASWDIESHMLNLIVNEQKTTRAEVEKAIAKAGHDTPDVKAADEDYHNLHGCCQYMRD